MSLPEALQGAVADWLGTHAGNRRQASTALSATYRAGGSSARVDLGSYLVARLPATFAAVDRVLAELARRRPDMAPASLLDAGSGPGTAAWAAAGPDWRLSPFSTMPGPFWISQWISPGTDLRPLPQRGRCRARSRNCPPGFRPTL